MSRKLLIRIMLWALGATAVAGAAAALMGGGDVGWRIVATGICTAVAAGLMLPFSMLADKPKARREGLAGMLLVVIEFAGALGLIWEIFEMLGDWHLDDEVGLTMLFLAMCALPGILFLRLSSIKTWRIGGIVGTMLAGVVFAFLMIAVWIGDRWWSNDEWFGTAGALAGFGLLATISLAGTGTAPRRWWRWIGVLAAAVACGIALYAIWMDIHSSSIVFATIVSIAAVIPHANLCLLVPLTASQRWVRWSAIIPALLTAGLLDALVWCDQRDVQIEMLGNFAAAAGIIAGCASLALLVLGWLNRNLDRKPVLTEIREITLICPGCKRRQTLPLGDSRCATCGLKLSIKVEEPRCPNCDYLLFMLQSDRCPECGTLIESRQVAGASA